MTPANSNPSATTSAVADEPVSWPLPHLLPSLYRIHLLALRTRTNPAAKLPTDAVRVTREQLALMLRQPYLHGSGHGWKAQLSSAKERLEAEYEKDMRDAPLKFGIHEKLICEEETERDFKDGRDVGRDAQLTSAKKALQAAYDKRHLPAFEDFAERSQELADEEFRHGFKDGRDAGIREEVEHWESARASQVDFSLPIPLISHHDCEPAAIFYPF